jgi:hypothetical protein
MQKYKYYFLANFIFLIHLTVIFIVLFGWYFKPIFAIYFLTLILALFSEAVLGYCFLTKWEFSLRKKINPDLNYGSAFINYYTQKYAGIKIPPDYIKYVSLTFLIVSLFLNLLMFLR